MQTRVVLSLLALLAFVFRSGLMHVADSLNGYGSKVACSLHYLQGRSLSHITARELAWPPIGIFVSLKLVNNTCIESRIWFLPFASSRTACLHEQGRLGCALLPRGKDSSFLDTSNVDIRMGKGDEISDFAVREPSEALAKLKVIDEHIADLWLNSRAFIVADASTYPAKILIEKYGDGFMSSSLQAGWSMSKSLMSTFIGSLIMNTDILPDGLETKVPLQGNVTATLKQLLQMTDGQDWDEIYAPLLDPVTMLFHREETGYVKGQRAQPGECFQYSSKTTNIISKFIKSKFPSESAYLNAPFKHLFRPINAQSVRIETDPSKVWVGSSFALMTALDWIRIGVLLANEGSWPASRKQIISSEYVKTIKEVSPTSSGVYGLHFWLGGNKNEFENTTEMDRKCDSLYSTRMNPARKWYSELPNGTFFMTGFEGQYLFVVPGTKLVVLRMGASREKMPLWKRFDPSTLILPVIRALDKHSVA